MYLLDLRMSFFLLCELIKLFHRQENINQLCGKRKRVLLWATVTETSFVSCLLNILFRLVDLQKKGHEKHTDSAIVPLYCCQYPLSLGVGCSASSLPEGCFPNHINEAAMLQPVLRSRRLCSRSSPIYTVPILI